MSDVCATRNPIANHKTVEVFAYHGRARSHSDLHGVGPWAEQSFLLFIAPVLLAATVYMALCRIIVAIGAEEHSMIRPRWLAKIYVMVDVLVFITQIGGIGLQITGISKIMAIGNKAIAGGLAFQFAVLFFFQFVAAKVHRRTNNGMRIGKYFAAIYIAAGAVALRSLVRLVEFAEGQRGTIASHEVFLYLFDAAPMLTIMIIFLAVYPGRLIKQCTKEKEIDVVPLVGPWT